MHAPLHALREFAKRTEHVDHAVSNATLRTWFRQHMGIQRHELNMLRHAWVPDVLLPTLDSFNFCRAVLALGQHVKSVALLLFGTAWTAVFAELDPHAQEGRRHPC